MTSACGFNVASTRVLIASVLLALTLSACGRPGSPDVPVSVHAVNYSDEEFEYTLEDPADQSNRGGGEAIGRFAAGGTMCCYSLPKKWRPGMKVKLNFELYFHNPSGGDARKTRNTEVVDIPQYANPEELWLVRAADGEMSIVLSNVQPDHPKWPGLVKGWPIPSVAYQRERWNLYMQHELSGLKLFEELQKELIKNPQKSAKEAWPNEIKYNSGVVSKFSGPDDPGFLVYMKNDCERALKRSRELIKQLEESKP